MDKTVMKLFQDPTNGSGYSIAADETWPLNFVHNTRGNTDIISKSFNADQIGQHHGGDCCVSVEVWVYNNSW
jgi:hypothetical protein